MSRIKVSDGSTWPRPHLESDEDLGVEWKIRYASDRLTRPDLLEAASIISAYEHLILGTTRAKRDLVCRDVRTALREERDARGDQDAADWQHADSVNRAEGDGRAVTHE